MAKLSGLKAQAKTYLKSKGIKKIVTSTGSQISLSQARTVDLIKTAIANGWE